MRGRLIAACAAAGLLLAGCAGEDPADKNTSDRPPAVAASTTAPAAAEPTRQVPAESDSFTFTDDTGTTGSLSLGQELPDDLAELAAIGERISEVELTFVVVDIDNREGTDSVSMYQLILIDSDGNQYESVPWAEMLYEAESEDYNLGMELAARTWHAGARGRNVAVFVGPLPEASIGGLIFLGGVIADPAAVEPA